MPDLGEFYYGSCVAHLTLRFDETLKVLEGKRPTSRQEAQGRAIEGRSTGRTAPGASRVEEVDAVSGADVRGTREPPTDLRPLVFPTDDPYTQIMNRVPIKGTFDLTGTRQAWTFDMEFDFRDVPIDPRVLRAVAVEIHLGTVDADQFAAGMGGSIGSFGQLQSILRTQAQFTNSKGATKNVTVKVNELFTGTADLWHVSHGDRGSVVRIKGRDIRGILLDTKVEAAVLAALDLSKPIHQVVAEIIATLPIDDDLFLTVETDPGEWDDGRVPSPTTIDGLTRVRRSADGAKGKSSGAGGDKTSYWDIITQYCNLVGAVPHLLGRTLKVRPARAIHERLLGRTSTGRDIDTPFELGRPRTVDGEELRVRRLVYGRDIKSLEFERKFGGVNVPRVEVVAIDDTKRGEEKLLIAQWPPKGSRAAELKADTDLLRIPAPGIRDITQLTSIAQNVYEEIGRGEMGGKADTKALTSFGGNNADPDMLRLRPTDAMELTVDVRALSSRSPLISDLTKHERRAFEEEVKEITERIGDPVLARVLVAVSRGAVVGQLSVFEVNNVRYGWDIKSGIDVSFDFQNYIIARHQEEAQVEEVAQKKPQKQRVTKKGQRKRIPTEQTPKPRSDRKGSIGALNSEPSRVELAVELAFSSVAQPGAKTRLLGKAAFVVGSKSAQISGFRKGLREAGLDEQQIDGLVQETFF